MNLPHLSGAQPEAAVCVVEIKGRKTLAPACVTKCAEGMEVLTHSLRAMNARRTVVELLISDHPKDCLTCPSSGCCELQNLAIIMGIREITSVENAAISTYRKDESPSLIRNMDKCVMCRVVKPYVMKFKPLEHSAINRGFMAVVAPPLSRI